MKGTIRLQDETEIHVKEGVDLYLQNPYKEGDSLVVGWLVKDAVLLPATERAKKLYI